MAPARLRGAQDVVKGGPLSGQPAKCPDGNGSRAAWSDRLVVLRMHGPTWSRYRKHRRKDRHPASYRDSVSGLELGLALFGIAAVAVLRLTIVGPGCSMTSE